MRAFRTGFGAVTLATITAFTLTACDTSATSPSAASPQPSKASLALTGNGGPSGAHYNLNIIGVSNDKSADFSGGNGGRIFVDLVGSTRINLTEGAFSVLDANGTDGTAAFQLPNPDDGTGQLAYSVWVRALGKPGGKASMATCFTELSTATTWCNSGDLVVKLNRVAGGQKFVDYKTNRPPPDAVSQVALAYRRQLALYRALLAEIYPGRTVRAFLLWTAVPLLMEIDAKTLDESMPYAAAP